MKKILVILTLVGTSSGCGAICSTLEQMSAYNVIMGGGGTPAICLPDIEINLPPDGDDDEDYGPGPGAF